MKYELKQALLKLLKRKRLQGKRVGNFRKWCDVARPEQRAPEGKWRVWLIMAGRGFGKTRTGAETVREWIESGEYKRIALVGDNILNTVQIMVEGVSGLLSCYPPGEGPVFERSKQRIVWPNGAVAELFSAEGYENLRGPQFDAAWVDELAKFKQPEVVWDQLMLSLRLGKSPKCIVTTTPKNIPLISSLQTQKNVVITRGSTFDNAANLAEDFVELMHAHYSKTHLAAQELYGCIVDTVDGALWRPEIIKYKQPNMEDER